MGLWLVVMAAVMVFLVVAAVAALAITGRLGPMIRALLAAEPKPRHDVPYRLVEGVLTPGERAFHGPLREAVVLLAAEHNRPEPLVLAKLRLGDVLRIDGAETQGNGSRATAARNRINQKHIDFVICNPATTRPVLAIELDDRSHDRADRRDRDGFVDEALAAAKLPLLRVKAAARYDPRAIAQAMGDKLGVRREAVGAGDAGRMTSA